MEGEIMVAPFRRLGHLLLLSVLWAAEISAQNSSGGRPQSETGHLTLQKTAQSREYQGREVEGEERRVAPGDSLWRLLVKEKGLAEKHFPQYLLMIRQLNPQVKNLDLLRVGDNLFIPSRPEDLLGAPAAAAKKEAEPAPIARGTTKEYRVEPGESLYQILREQLKISGQRELALHYALVRDLNPERKNWDLLKGGELIQLPEVGPSAEATLAAPTQVAAVKTTEPAKPAGEKDLELAAKREGITGQDRPGTPSVVGLDYPRQLRARENITLMGEIAEALGNEVQRLGEELVPIKDGTVRIDRTSYPIVNNSKLQQKIILDPNEKISISLRAKLTESSIYTPVFSLTRTVSLQDSVAQLLSRLGYQFLAGDRPVVVQDSGVTFEARGNWIVLAPEESNKPQEVFVITLTNNPAEVPEYLRKILSLRGLHLKDILLPNAADRVSVASNTEPNETELLATKWPREKREFVNALLLAFGVSSRISETLSVELYEGLRIDMRCDRVFERDGRRTAVFFQRLEPEVKKALQEKGEIDVIELDLPTLEHKEIMDRLSSELGEPAAYQEHRFSASASNGRLNIAAWGFLLEKRGLFVTDREIPPFLHRFFFEKGLEIVYF
jgi:hypothetical protein